MPKSKEKCQELRDKMKNTIIQKSILYFARNGFDGTKISDLSKAIGIAQGTIYVYFDSKEDLYKEIVNITGYKEELNKLKVLIKLPIPAREKIRMLSKSVLSQIAEEEMFAAKIALNTQMMLSKDKDGSSAHTSYQSELYACTAKIIEQGQKEGCMIKDSSLKLADYYWSVVYVYALKRLFTSQYETINVEDLCRVLLVKN